MQTKTHIAHTSHSAHTTQQPKQQRLLPTISKPTKAAIRLIVSVAVFLAICIFGWNKLRAEFDESFNRFSACPTVDLKRMA